VKVPIIQRHLRLLLLAALCVVASPVFAEVIADIPADRQFILKSAGDWVPSATQTSESLLRIQSFLESAIQQDKVLSTLGPNKSYERDQIKSILGNNQGYRVQFWGIKKADRQIIYCNFFPAAPPKGQDEFNYWRKDRVEVTDGGFYCWHAEYDPFTKSIIYFVTGGIAANTTKPSKLPPTALATIP
jgi:hypothetical protein